MSTSFATVTTSKMELSPMRVTFNGTDLGGTLGNVTVGVEIKKADIKADQSGETVRDRRVSGQVFKVTTELAEIKSKDIWKVAFPSMNLVTSGGNKQIYVDAQIGKGDLAAAKILILHPLSLDNTDLSGNYLFYKAVAAEVSEIKYGPTEQARLKVEWMILPDDSVQPERFFIHGDPSIGLINASAGTPAFTGTGNGTISTPSVSNSATKTETITVKALSGGAGGNVFSVTGSLSGALGDVTLAAANTSTVPFISGPINFTITQSTVQFVLNDQWTIATTAANYV